MRFRCVARVETADPQDEVQTLAHGVQASLPAKLLFISPDLSPPACSRSSSRLLLCHSLNTPCSFMLLRLHTALAVLGKPLLHVGYLDVFIPGSLSLRAHLHLEGLFGLPGWSECFLLGALTWSCSALTAPITNGTDMYSSLSGTLLTHLPWDFGQVASVLWVTALAVKGIMIPAAWVYYEDWMKWCVSSVDHA